MLTDILTNWLNGSQNFIVGRAFYKYIGKDERVKELLKKGESPASKNILVDAITDIFKLPSLIPQQKHTATDEMPGGQDIVLTALKEEWMPLYQKMNYLRTSLDKYSDSNSEDAIEYRSPIAFEILDIEKQVMFIWHKRDYYLQHGKLPATQTKEKEIPTDPFELGRYVENIKKNIRKNRQKMQRPGADAKYAELYQKYLGDFREVTGKDYEEKTKQPHEQGRFSDFNLTQGRL